MTKRVAVDLLLHPTRDLFRLIHANPARTASLISGSSILRDQGSALPPPLGPPATKRYGTHRPSGCGYCG